MGIRDIKTIEFTSLMTYLDWYAEQYHNQTGIKVVELTEADEDKIKATYIELF